LIGEPLDPTSATIRAMSSATASAGVVSSPEPRVAPRHAGVVRFTHWVTAASFVLLLWSGIEILISHPRLYWGEYGNVNTPALLQIPIPSSRGAVPTGYGYVLPDQNGWSRSMHFQSAWALVIVALLYGTYGLVAGHFARNLWPRLADLRPRALLRSIRAHLRLRPDADEGDYNVLQRIAYSGVVFVVFPLMIWTGLAMSPAVVSAFPALATVLGGHQSARTVHFFAAIALVLFLFGHLAMVGLTGFVSRTRAMITGHAKEGAE
jgi:thiosulfate reductase cytochrome b subunit